jgi:hypothetical protein
MRKTEYTCDWCHRVMPPERAYELTLRAMFTLAKSSEPKPATNDEPSHDQALNQLQAWRERDKQGMQVDVCNSCFAELRSWIETRMRR